MVNQERLRVHGKGAADDAEVLMPDAARGGAATASRRPKRRNRRRLLTVCGGLCCITLLLLFFTSSTRIPVTSSTVPPPTPGNGTQSSIAPAPPVVKDRITEGRAAKDATSQKPTTPIVASTTGMVDTRTSRRPPTSLDRQLEDGECEPEEPDRLPRMQAHRRTYTPAELLAKYAATDYIYTFANGSEANHHYRKLVSGACLKAILSAEAESYRQQGPTFRLPYQAQANAAETKSDHLVESTTVFAKEVDTMAQADDLLRLPPDTPFAVLKCTPSVLRSHISRGKTLGELYAAVNHRAVHGGADNRDRETDELRHSIRSVEQHVRWHRGRVVIVSPGHYPTWVDAAKNFLAGRCGDKKVQALRESGTHLRLTTVHQDALMPDGERLTSNSHVIEQHLWRVRNITPVHVYMNDDYFVNRDVEITDLFNEYGGTIVRTERSVLGNGAVADTSASWAKGVYHAHQFNIQELDVNREDYLPQGLVRLWNRFARIGANRSIEALLPLLYPSRADDAVDIAHLYPPEPLTPTPLAPRRPRRYATHAPFVYCTNMFRFFSTRYEREFAAASLHHRGRRAQDLFLPFLYNAFIMARPWQASPRFLPYLLELQRHRVLGMMDTMPKLAIELDNMDGCAPATLRGGRQASGCAFGKFLNNMTLNALVMQRMKSENALYFNINAGFNSQEASDQLRAFLHDKFPNPTYLEAPMVAAESPAEEDDAKYVNLSGESSTPSTTAPPVVDKKGDASMTRVFDALMALPVVGLVSYDEGACPLVRSLALAFVDRHQGPVRVVVQRHSDEGEEEVSLAEARTTLQNRIYSAMPVPQCAFASHVTVQAAPKSATVADMVGDALESTVANSTGKVAVELPSTCGESGAGLRVRGFVVDARTPGAPVMSRATLREALAVPGQTLALEDFRVVTVGPGPRDVVLVLAREDAAAKAVHWVTGGAENDLLVTYPLPVPAYEDMSAPLKWSQP